MVRQKYSSAVTSINGSKLPSVFRKVEWVEGTRNLDYGGGKYDIATNWLLDHKNVRNYIYDPYNRTFEHNLEILAKKPFDTITLSNVLNVVMEKEVRETILSHCYLLLRTNGTLYISVYEGDKSKVAKVNEKRNSCQLNRPLKDYFNEVAAIFGEDHIEIKNGVMKVRV
ncbi:MAG: hypothetical protein LIR50_19190 [Bacillota bacterium]|nr:hypothetical protein [Bacillota bacterium]